MSYSDDAAPSADAPLRQQMPRCYTIYATQRDMRAADLMLPLRHDAPRLPCAMPAALMLPCHYAICCREQARWRYVDDAVRYAAYAVYYAAYACLLHDAAARCRCLPLLMLYA